MSGDIGLGKRITGEAARDAVHVAVCPVECGDARLAPCQPVGLVPGSQSVVTAKEKPIGIVDPFLVSCVDRGDRFYLWLFPGSITSLRHDWTHPAFSPQSKDVEVTRSRSERWMRAWAVEHMGQDYYGDGEDLSEDEAYAKALRASRTMNVGPYEDAREHIDNEWWTHWENITGEEGNPGEYFSCAC